MNAAKIRFNNVRYRQGFMEVIANIHPGHINVEMWAIHPDIDISDKQLGDGSLEDSSVAGNTEIELSVSEAKSLVAILQTAIARAEEDQH